MANTIQIKRKTTSGAPTLGALAEGEFCLVEPDNTLFLRHNGAVRQLIVVQEISQAAYDALSPPDSNVLYLITS